MSDQYPVLLFFDKLLTDHEMSIEVNKPENEVLLYKAMNGTLTVHLVKHTFQSINDLYISIIEISDLLKELEKQNLLRTYHRNTETNNKIELGIPKILAGKSPGPDPDVNKLFIQLLEKGIIIKNDLVLFKKRNFTTQEERKESFQKKISLFSLITAITIGLGGLLLNIIKLYDDCP